MKTDDPKKKPDKDAPQKEALREALDEYAAQHDTDVFIHCGPISYEYGKDFVTTVLTRRPKRPNVTVLLSTFGGDAHSAARMARVLRAHYEKVVVLVVGMCKSAGTLVVLAADEIAFTPWGELGPLDLQVNKPDEIAYSASGLDTFRGVSSVSQYAFEQFVNFMFGFLEASQGAVSTKMACDVAARLAVGVFRPISAQIDPHRLGEISQGMDIAREYGERLRTSNVKVDRKNPKQDTLHRLINGYPSHGFVIDLPEAKTLFNEVRWMSKGEYALVSAALLVYGNQIIEPSFEIDETICVDVRKEVGENANESKIKQEDGTIQPAAPNEGLDGHHSAHPADGPAEPSAGGEVPAGPAAGSGAPGDGGSIPIPAVVGHPDGTGAPPKSDEGNGSAPSVVPPPNTVTAP